MVSLRNDRGEVALSKEYDGRKKKSAPAKARSKAKAKPVKAPSRSKSETRQAARRKPRRSLQRRRACEVAKPVKARRPAPKARSPRSESQASKACEGCRAKAAAPKPLRPKAAAPKAKAAEAAPSAVTSRRRRAAARVRADDEKAKTVFVERARGKPTCSTSIEDDQRLHQEACRHCDNFGRFAQGLRVWRHRTSSFG